VQLDLIADQLVFLALYVFEVRYDSSEKRTDLFILSTRNMEIPVKKGV